MILDDDSGKNRCRSEIFMLFMKGMKIHLALAKRENMRLQRGTVRVWGGLCYFQPATVR